jgi:hypothetical protein
VHAVAAVPRRRRRRRARDVTARWRGGRAIPPRRVPVRRCRCHRVRCADGRRPGSVSVVASSSWRSPSPLTVSSPMRNCCPASSAKAESGGDRSCGGCPVRASAVPVRAVRRSRRCSDLAGSCFGSAVPAVAPARHRPAPAQCSGRAGLVAQAVQFAHQCAFRLSPRTRQTQAYRRAVSWRSTASRSRCCHGRGQPVGVVEPTLRGDDGFRSKFGFA